MKKLLKTLILVLLLGQAALAYNNISMWTVIDTSPAGVTFTAYYNNDDSVIQTEDSFNNTENAGYDSTLGIARVQTDQITGLSAASSYQIWVASSSNTARYTEGTVSEFSPSYTSPGSFASKLVLSGDYYLEVPANFTATPGLGKIDLSWTGVSGATEYRVYRRAADSANKVYTKVGATASTSLSDTNVASGTTYYYIIVASTAGKRSGHSSEVSATPYSVEYITISPISKTLYDGQSQTYLVTAYYQGGTSEVSATLSKPAGASGTISGSTYTAPATVGAEETVVITASYAGKTATSNAYLAQTVLQTIAVTPDSPTMRVGQTEQFSAIGSYSDSSTKEISGSVVWESSNTSIATVNAAGSVNALTAGSITIKASLNGIENSSFVIVNPLSAPVADYQSVETDEDNAVAITLTGSDSDTPAEMLTYNIVATPEHGTLTGDAPNLTYTPVPNFNGYDSFTFRINDGSLNSNTATVSITVASVNDAPVMTSAAISPETPLTTDTLNAAGNASDVDSYGITYTYQWKKNGAVISGQTGTNLTSSNFVKNDSIAVVITPYDGSLYGDPMESSAVVITGIIPTVTQAEIVPAKSTALPAEVVNITINYKDADNNTLETAQTTWTAPEIAGTYDVKSSISVPTGIEKTGNTQVSVVPGALSTVVITPADAAVEQGKSVTFTAKGYDAYNNERTDDVFTYESALGNSPTVTANIAEGVYQMTANKDGKSATAVITVTKSYTGLTVSVVDGKVTLTAVDYLNNTVPVSGNASVSSVAYNITGQEYGNTVNNDGTVVTGTQDGTYTLTSTVVIDGQTVVGTADITVNKNAPVLTAKIDSQDINSNLTISSRPRFEIEASDGNGIKAIHIYIDGSETSGLSLSAQDTSGTSVAASYRLDTELTVGTHTIKIVAEDNLGTETTIVASSLTVYDSLAIEGKPINYPNPFKPSAGATTIYYKLTQDADTKIMIYDMTGKMVYTQAYLAGDNGGRIENTPTWDGKSFAGERVGNGVYVYFITSGGKVIGTGEIAVYE